jgi:hypothetical protein
LLSPSAPGRVDQIPMSRSPARAFQPVAHEKIRVVLVQPHRRFAASAQSIRSITTTSTHLPSS